MSEKKKNRDWNDFVSIFLDRTRCSKFHESILNCKIGSTTQTDSKLDNSNYSPKVFRLWLIRGYNYDYSNPEQVLAQSIISKRTFSRTSNGITHFDLSQLHSSRRFTL